VICALARDDCVSPLGVPGGSTTPQECTPCAENTTPASCGEDTGTNRSVLTGERRLLLLDNGSVDDDCGLQGCDAVWSSGNISPASSGCQICSVELFSSHC
jgi:hypothetical protein